MGIWCVLVLCVLLVCSCNRSEAFNQSSLVRQEIVPPGYGYVNLDPKYDRMDEVSKACAPMLSSAAKLRLTKGERIAMMDSLSFYKGEWYQIGGKSPLMPYVPVEYVSGSRWSKRMRRDRYSFSFNLASFMLSDVNSSSPIENFIGVYGVLDVAIGMRTSNRFWQGNARGVPSFELFPGVSKLSIGFQGLYFESDERGGEKILCLLGDAKLPSRSDDPSNPWPWAKASNSSPSEPPFSRHDQILHVSHDDQILLVLRYPITVSIPNVAVRGELKSLNPVTDNKYFDEVRLLALSNEVNDNYQFSSREVPGGACDPYPSADSLLDRHIDMYKGSDICGMLNSEILRGGPLTFVPNWRCKRSREHCRQLGPFKMEATNRTFTGALLLMQNVQCKAKFVKPNDTEARVFAVFRARLMGGLSNTTLVAEGKWRSSTGQLCMVGCVMTFDPVESACDSRICLYIPVSLSITQRSLLFGSISSIKAGEAAYFPLSFQREFSFWDRLSELGYRYRYSVLGSLKTDEPSDLSVAVEKTLLKYPRLDESADYMSSLDLLAQDLILFGSLRDTNLSSWHTTTHVQMTVLALGPLLGRSLRMYRFDSFGSRKWGNESHLSRSHYYTKAASANQRPLLNVSAILTLHGDNYTNLSPLSLEGLYDYRTGKMRLIGCRDITHFLETPFDSKTLKAGFDCLIEVNVSYPPTRLQWLAQQQGAEISISSKRDVDDPLYFHPIELETSPISYSQQRKDILSRIGIKGALRLLMLSVAVFIIQSQLLHIRKTSVVDSVPYMSLVMLGVQVVGYGISLILEAKAYLSKNSKSYDQSRYMVSESPELCMVDYMVPPLVLICFLLTLTLFQRVWESRARLLVQFPNEPSQVPSDKGVLLGTSTIHVMVYMIIIVPSIFGGVSRTKLSWEALLEEYIGLVQGLFLLPQVLGNVIWNTKSQPLMKVYYVGMTMVTLLPHVYDIFYPQDFFTHSLDIVISWMALLLLVIVHLQQTYSFLIDGSTSRLLSVLVGSRGYEKVSSDVPESELTTNVDGRHLGKSDNGDLSRS